MLSALSKPLAHFSSRPLLLLRSPLAFQTPSLPPPPPPPPPPPLLPVSLSLSLVTSLSLLYPPSMPQNGAARPPPENATISGIVVVIGVISCGLVVAGMVVLFTSRHCFGPPSDADDDDYTDQCHLVLAIILICCGCCGGPLLGVIFVNITRAPESQPPARTATAATTEQHEVQTID